MLALKFLDFMHLCIIQHSPGVNGPTRLESMSTVCYATLTGHNKTMQISEKLRKMSTIVRTFKRTLPLEYHLSCDVNAWDKIFLLCITHQIMWMLYPHCISYASQRGKQIDLNKQEYGVGVPGQIKKDENPVIALTLHMLQSYAAMVFIKKVTFVLLCFLGKSQYFSIPGMRYHSKNSMIR